MDFYAAFEAVQLTDGRIAVMAIGRDVINSHDDDLCIAVKKDLRKAVRLARKLNDLMEAEGGYTYD